MVMVAIVVMVAMAAIVVMVAMVAQIPEINPVEWSRGLSKVRKCLLVIKIAGWLVGARVYVNRDVISIHIVCVFSYSSLCLKVLGGRKTLGCVGSWG